MTAIQDALTSISLEKYSEAFDSAGFNNLEDFFSLSPNDLDKLLTEIGMLKGHTFKLKKIIEDAKVGNLPKRPPPPLSAPAPVHSTNFPASQPVNSIKTVPVQVAGKPEVKVAETNHGKDLIDKTNAMKNQLNSICQSKETLVNSLRQLVELDLDKYFHVIAQLKNMQASIRGMINQDVEMGDN